MCSIFSNFDGVVVLDSVFVNVLVDVDSFVVCEKFVLVGSLGFFKMIFGLFFDFGVGGEFFL